MKIGIVVTVNAYLTRDIGSKTIERLIWIPKHDLEKVFLAGPNDSCKCIIKLTSGIEIECLNTFREVIDVIENDTETGIPSSTLRN